MCPVEEIRKSALKIKRFDEIWKGSTRTTGLEAQNRRLALCQAQESHSASGFQMDNLEAQLTTKNVKKPLSWTHSHIRRRFNPALTRSKPCTCVDPHRIDKVPTRGCPMRPGRDTSVSRENPPDFHMLCIDAGEEQDRAEMAEDCYFEP
jgi:hypothetical protein